MDTTKDIERYLERKADQWEIYMSRSNLTYIDIEGNRIEHLCSGIKEGLGIRVSVGKKIGFAYTDNLNAFARCADNAIYNSKISKADKDFESFALPGRYPKTKQTSKSIESYDTKEFGEYIEQFTKILKANSDKLVAGIGNYRKDIDYKRIINSQGVNFQDKIMKNTVFFESMKFGDISMGFGDAGTEPLDPEKADEFAKRLMAMKGKKAVKTGKMDVLFHPDALGGILEPFINYHFNAENIDKKRTTLHNMSGQKVFGENLTLYDDPKAKGLFETRKGDDEGTPSKVRKIVKDGKIIDFLFDSYHSNKMKRNQAGNAFRTPFSLPTIYSGNLIMKAGKKEIVPENLLYVKGLMGTHTINAATGEFSLSVYEGEMIDKDSRYPVKDTMISGNVFWLLNNIVEIGKETRHYYGDGSVYLPHVLVSGLQVIGSG